MDIGNHKMTAVNDLVLFCHFCKLVRSGVTDVAVITLTTMCVCVPCVSVCVSINRPPPGSRSLRSIHALSVVSGTPWTTDTQHAAQRHRAMFGQSTTRKAHAPHIRDSYVTSKLKLPQGTQACLRDTQGTASTVL